MLLALLLALAAAGARAEEALTPTAAVAAAVTPVPAEKSGLEFGLSLSSLSLFNGAALSYSPFELGWRFENGLRLRTGLDIFYYEGLDVDAKNPANGFQNYSYDMTNWRSSLLYVVPLPFSVRPVAGVTFEMLRGDRRLADPALVNPPKIEAWNLLGPGAVLGMHWRAGQHFAVELLGRYSFSFSQVGAIASGNLGWVYLF